MFPTEQLLDTFFILSFGTPLTLLLSFWLVGRFIWLPMKEEYSKDRLTKTVPPYINRYPFNPENPVTDCSGVVLDSIVVVEDTDYGLVVLRYKDDMFEYWADATPQYQTLESAARKFVVSFHCEHLYIHRLYELHKAYAAKIKKEEEDKKTKSETVITAIPKNNNSIFARFKKKVNTVKKKSNIITCEKANVFKKKGRLSECIFFNPEKEEKVVQSFSFCDWKKINFS